MAALLLRANCFVYSDGGRGLCVFGGLCTCRHVAICTPKVIFAVLTVFRLYLTIVGTLLDNRHKSTIRLVTIGTLMVNWSFLLFRLPFDDWNTVGTLLVQSW